MKHRSWTRFVLEGLEGAALLAAAYATWPVSKRWLTNWGSTPTERIRLWSGDSLVRAPIAALTRAIDIDAPADTVWRWLVQFGMGRAGFYSYELLERVAGIPVRNLESIEPELQSLDVGDEIFLHPKAPGIRIALLQPGRGICFGGAPERPEDDHSRSWSIYVDPVSEDRCRLVLRSCFTEPGQLPAFRRLSLGIEQPLDFVMEQRMMRTIKRLAEAS